MARHNLGTVIGFELTRTVKKRRFWVATLAVPALVAGLAALVVLSNESTEDAIAAQRGEGALSFVYTDSSGLVAPAAAAAFGGTVTSDAATALEEVRAGDLDAFVVFPADPATDPVVVHGQDLGIFENERYAAVARQVLVVSAEEAIASPGLARLVQGDVAVTTVTYEDGVQAAGFEAALPPLLLMGVFYATIILLGNQMLNSTLEEKENRVTEMILTTLEPTTLVVGKIISLFLVGLVQVLALGLPVAVGYVLFREEMRLPALDLSDLVLEPGPLAVSVLLLVGGFVLFTGSLVAIGAVVPTVKEAGNFFAPLIIVMFVPLYVLAAIVSDPESVAVRVLTYFPYTAPVTAMIRNAFGSLGAVEATIVVVELFTLGVVALRLAVRLFRYGSVEYSRRLSMRDALRGRAAR